MHRVAVLALDRVIPFETSIPVGIFGDAARPDGTPLYEVAVCTVGGHPMPAATANNRAGALAEADTVVLPAVHPVDAVIPHGRLRDEIADALARIPAGARLVSIRTATFILAAAGLLDGRRVTIHWPDIDRFQRMFPRVKMDPDMPFIDDGDVLTSAVSGAELYLRMVRRDHGSEVATRLARRWIMSPWPDGRQTQHIGHLVPEPWEASTAATRAWALERLQEPVSLPDLAAHARMSVRTFTRRFRQEVGLTPGQWLTGQRLQRAQHLLESSDLPIDRVAEHAGFGATVSLRQHFRTAFGVPPAAYRRTFRARNDCNA
ncbi:GlxA family transcriptional regulator [Frankia sp. Cj3]|uniref:GlxA family transcriptional regulator n=1 Tax=Frankia sp. Cj3 TaxID=2880976 RepID=UPI001EF5A2E1|nr:helix-turn-helix domain-containing protein [Frankia sp. Cj3]